ncbi:uncharacterized protein H6S33_002189 [Morchella sextelata]|uniref:uncharacterized protein n=1 Tax=Morchella sextelata TaxID=1174677 RepID=UPI001D03AB7B|nr:uncharacterized protein H6S33_002189 [Morchella sextelata]KAH0608137.1 hypothetical protein H6S33_002189 [Morchella sextelata]
MVLNPPPKRSAPAEPNLVAKKRKASTKGVNSCPYPDCGKTFTKPCRLEEHIRSHTGERPYICTADPENCDKRFLRNSHLKAHVKALHTKEKSFKCTFMIVPGNEEDRGAFGFKRKAPGGAIEQNNGDGKEPRECGATFTTNQHLNRHLESHMKSLPHVCTDYPPCSEGFRKRGPLRRHIREVHLKLLPWGCTYKDVENPEHGCTAAFDTKGKLGGHIDKVHKGLIPALYTCAMCSAYTEGEKGPEPAPGEEIIVTPRQGTEQEGNKTSTGNPDLCNGGIVENLSPESSTPFPVVRSMLVTKPVEKIFYPETARLQGKIGFKTYLELRRHTIHMHPPTCVQCRYTFKNARNLKVHIANTHGALLEERRHHICEQCGTGFTKKHALKVHVRRVHEDLRPFACVDCPKTYGYKSQLQIHIENHHSGRRKPCRKPRGRSTKKPNLIQQLTGMGYEESGRNIECVVDNCDYRFVRIYDLKVHLRSLKHHGFDEGQVEELIIDAEGGRREENGEYNENDDEDEDEMTDTDSSGSGSDEESDVIADGMEYVNLWDDMGDMDLDKESGDVSGEE